MTRYDAMVTFYADGRAVKIVDSNGREIKLIYLGKNGGNEIRFGIEAPKELGIIRTDNSSGKKLGRKI